MPYLRSRPAETGVGGIIRRLRIRGAASEKGAAGHESREAADTHYPEADRTTQRESALVCVADKVGPHVHLFSGPDLFSAPKQADVGNREEIPRAVPSNQLAFDLGDFRAQRSSQGQPAGVVDVECDLGTDLRSPPGGPQRITARQEDAESGQTTNRNIHQPYVPFGADPVLPDVPPVL